MLRSALILSAGLLAALCFACVAVVPPPPPPPAPAAAPELRRITAIEPAGRRVLDCDASSFVNKIYTLSTSYVPGNTNGYTPPSPGVQISNPPAPSTFLAQVAQDLGGAYCAASSTFQRQLDAITTIFITCDIPSNCTPTTQNVFVNSWGYRENSATQSVLQRTYVALSANLWPQSGSPMVYSHFEYLILDNLLGIPTSTPPSQQPVTIVATPDTSTLTVLAALAHEMGHIYWWKLGVENYDCGSGLGRFGDISWNYPRAASLMFHNFGKQQPPNAVGRGGSVPHGNHKQKDQVIRDLGSQNEYKDLANIYNNGYWASLFATVTPDEDFVESYKLWALTAALPGLTSLQITVNGPSPYSSIYIVNPINPPGFMTDGQSELNDKAAWIQTCFAWPS